MIARPTVAEERWLVLADRYPALRTTIEEAGHEGVWKTTTWLARCVGFLLGLLGTGLFAGVLAPFSSPWLVGGLIMMAVAEWLVATRRIFRSGVEEALYLCGAVAAVVQILIWNRSSDHEEIGVAMMSGAVLLVGWRLLNPLFTTLAAAGFSLAVSAIGGHLFDSRAHGIEAAIFCAVLAVSALVLGGRMWHRPSHDHMLEGLMILMPSLSYLWLLSGIHHGDALTRTPWALAIATAFFVVNLIAGVRRRQHAPLIAALGSLACMVHALHRLVSWSLHWKMIACGAALLVVALLLDRWLKQPRSSGITSQPAVEPASLGLVELAAAAHLAPATGAPPPEAVHGQGGSFGGGGASGRF